MKAAFINQTGPPENIVYGEFPKPAPSDTQVLVRVKAVSVNPIDTYLRGGKVTMKLPMPYIVGCDLTGIVEAVGRMVRRFKPGDRVWGSNQGLLGRQGTFAEWAVVDESWLYPTPANASDEAVAAMALVGITAHLGLVRVAKLLPTDTLFINGGSGGVGSAVIQIAKAIGARVIAAAGSDAKVEKCRQFGADLAFNYRSVDIGTELRRSAPDGISVWWETAREPDFDRVVAALAPRGRMILMAGREARPPFPVGPFYVKGCSLHGFAMFGYSAQEQQPSAEDINGWFAAGKLHAVIDRVLPLSEAAAAHRLQEENTLAHAGTLSGKIVLRP
ncbi:MAG: NADPH:quinone reductase [Candidatus Omnitrophica bacterium]|nr:NADPH:quinone reductase [Candidatus Omnitrophota bacterium]